MELRNAIDLYGVYYPIQTIICTKNTTITTDSQVVVLEILGDKVKVCRFGNYQDNSITNITNLPKFQTKR